MVRRKRLSKTEREAILQQYGGVCYICGWAIEGAFDVDHVIPLAAGGTNEIDNLAPVHKSCHRRKTAEKDMPVIAKVRRLRGEAKRRRKWKWPKRKLSSRKGRSIRM